MRRSLPLLALLAACPHPQPTEVTVHEPAEGPPAAAPPSDDTPLPFDDAVHTGTLDNGLRWFIEVNNEPSDRAVLRLAFEAGSVLEDDDQLGLAHFVEHMAFNGTKNYPGNELITYLEGVGTSFGPHLNAHTSFDETVYKLMVPTDDEAVYAEAFQVLDDWACCLTFDEEEIEKERGVVLEEWRTRQGASDRITQQIVPVQYYQSTYAERLPIGTEESLKTFKPDAARRFFKDWYRPDLAAVIVVGSVDPVKTQALIEQHFSDWAMPAEPRERVRHDLPSHDETLAVVVADPEVTRSSVYVMRTQDGTEQATHKAYRESVTKGLVTRMFNERLGELARLPDTAFLGASMGESRMTPTETSSQLSAAAKPGQELATLEAMWTELERAKRHGFQAGELERAKQGTLQFYRSLLLQEDDTSSVRHAEELIRHVTTGESVPGLAYEVKLAEAWIPEVSLAEVNAWMAAWMAADSRAAMTIMPKQDGLAVPTKEQLIATIAKVEATTDIAAPAAEVEARPPVTERPPTQEPTVVDDQFLDTLGYMGWSLPNGVQVWVKETDFNPNEIQITGWAAGGTYTEADEDLVALHLADDWVHASGFGELNATELRRWLSGKQISLSHGFSAQTDEVNLRTTPADLDAALALLWASFTAPRFDDDARSVVFQGQVASRENRLSDPGALFADADEAALWPASPRWQAWTVDDINAANDPVKLEALYRRHFTDATGFTFVVTGALPEGFDKTLATWLGALPTTDEPRTTKSLDVAPAPGPHVLEVVAGTAPKSQVKLQWLVDFEDQAWLTRNRQLAVRDVLSVLLREKLREELGGVYGVGVSASAWRTPQMMSAITVSFTCDPDRVDELVAAAQGVIDGVIAAPVEARYVLQEQEKGRRSREESLESNGFWGGGLAGALQRGEDPNEILTWDARNDSLTPENVHAAAKRFLSDTPTVTVVLKPEASADK